MIRPAPGGTRRRGFTLLELLVVLLIVSLLVALVPPLFSGAVPGAKLKAAVRDLAVTLRLARNLGLGLTDRAGPLKRLIMQRALGRVGELPSLARPGS